MPATFKNRVTALFGNIRFWLVAFFLLRLFSITSPPLEVSHNWRQTTVTMVARNFMETDNNILYPRIDIAGEKPGITGMEFPVLNYLIYFTSLIFGYDHWYGRLINLIVSTIGIWFFYRLIKKYFSETTAFYSAFILILSVWFTYSRKIMPDTFSVSLATIGFYYATQFFDFKPKVKFLLGYFLFMLLGVLSKLPTAYLLILFAPFIFNKNIALNRKVIFISSSLLILIISSIYYFRWVPFLNTKFDFEHFYMGTGFADGGAQILSHLNDFFQKFYMEAIGISGFLLFLVGLFFVFKNKNRALLWIFILASIGFSVIILKAGFGFYHHTYYIIPFAPIMSLIAGSVFEKIGNTKWIVTILFVFTVEAITTKNSDFYIKENNYEILKLEGELDKLGSRNDLIFINSGNVPTPMYFAHRKGWVGFNDKIGTPQFVDSLQAKGLKWLVILKKAFGENIDLPYQLAADNTNLKIYRIDAK